MARLVLAAVIALATFPAQAHWEKTRAGTALLAETRAIIRCMVEIAHASGLMKAPEDMKAPEEGLAGRATNRKDPQAAPATSGCGSPAQMCAEVACARA